MAPRVSFFVTVKVTPSPLLTGHDGVAIMLAEPLLPVPPQPVVRSWKCLLLTSLAASGVMIACVPRLPTDKTDHIPSMSTLEVEPGSYVIPPPCLTVMVGTALSGTALLAALTVAVPAIGFCEDGVEAESIAAAWQATIGDVEKESLFATFQSLAARGELLSILNVGLPVVSNLAVASAAFCSKLDEIEDASTGAAQAVANATAAALTQIEQAAQDSGAVEKLEGVADSVVGAAKESADKIVAEAEEWAEKAAKEAKEALSPTADVTKNRWEEVTGSCR